MEVIASARLRLHALLDAGPPVIQIIVVAGCADGFGPDRLAPDLRQRREEVHLLILRQVGILAEKSDRAPVVALVPDQRAARARDDPAPVPAGILAGRGKGAAIIDARAAFELDPGKGAHV